MTDEEPTEDELREAEALARALERRPGRSEGAPPGDALETAALLRFSRDGGALDPARAEALLGDALSRARAPARASRKAWLLGALGLAAATAAAAIAVLGPGTSPGRPHAAALPAPPPALLAAQLELASRRTTDLATLNRETAAYRAAVFAAMKDRYQP